MSDQHLAALRSVPIFSGLDEVGLGHIVGVAAEFEAHSGHVFIEHGQPAAGCFVILEGNVRVELPSGEQIERGPGDFFGELSVLTDSLRTARVMAASDVRCLAIGRDDLLALVDREPTIAVAMLKAVAHRLAETT